MKKGLFITFEGGDGSGKSTLSRALGSSLKDLGRETLLTREPGGTQFAERVREIFLHDGHICSARTELLLVLAARNDHVEKVIRPALEKGVIVLCDRFIDSTVVYQGFAAHEDPIEVEKLAFHAVPLLPDCTFIIDVPTSLGMKRRSGRTLLNHDTMEKRDLSFHELVREGFISQAKRHPNRIHLLDGEKPIGVLLEHIQSILKPVLKP